MSTTPLFRSDGQNPGMAPPSPLYHVHAMHNPLPPTECRTGEDDEVSLSLYGKGEDTLQMQSQSLIS